MATQQVHSLVHKMVLDDQAYIKGIKQTRSEQQLLKGVIESMKTPLQKYEDGLEVLNKQLKAGKLTQEQFKFASKQLKNEMAKSNETIKKQSEGLGKQKKLFDMSFGPASLGKLGATAVAYKTIKSAIMEVVEAQKAKIAADKEARGIAASVGDSESAVITNLAVGTSNKSAKQFLQSLKGVQKQTGFGSVSPINLAASEVLSATGSNQSQTVDILKAAAPFFKANPGELGTFGGAVADLQKSTGIKDAEKAVSFALALQSQARFKDLGGFKNVAPALAAAAGSTSGDKLTNARQSGALFAAIGGSLGDVDANITKGATANLVANLGKVAPQFDTTNERLQFVRQNPALQDEVLKSGFRGATVPVLKQLFDPNSEISKNLASSFGKIVAKQEDFALKRSQLTGLTSNLREKGFQAGLAGSNERADIARANAVQLESQARQIFDNLLAKRKNGLAGPLLNTAAEVDFQRDSFLSGSNVSGTDRLLTKFQIGISGALKSAQESGDKAREKSLRDQQAFLNEQRQLLIQAINDSKAPVVTTLD